MLLASLAVLTVLAAHPTTVFQLSLAPNAQLFSSDSDVLGLRVGLGVGANREVAGLDLGLLNLSEQLDGVQLAALVNLDDTGHGLRVAPLNVGGHFAGLEVGVVNLGFSIFSSSSADGVQLGLLNATHRLRGVQVGLYNESDRAAGLQLGVVNVARELRGVQLGLLNFAHDALLPCSPLVNARF